MWKKQKGNGRETNKTLATNRIHYYTGHVDIANRQTNKKGTTNLYI